MKTGVVLEIKNNKAIIMLTGGAFVTVDAKTDWNKSDVVSIQNNRFSMKTLYIAACFIFIFFGIIGFNLYFTQTSVVSIDINPSIEIGLNRFDKVIHISSFNDDGEGILRSVKLIHKNYLEVVEALLASKALARYLTTDKVWIFFAIQSDISGKSSLMSEALSNKIKDLSKRQFPINVDCQIVSSELVIEAHAYGLTPGKYSKIMLLKSLLPDINIDDYSKKSIKEIMNIIEPFGNDTGSAGNQELPADSHINANSSQETSQSVRNSESTSPPNQIKNGINQGNGNRKPPEGLGGSESAGLSIQTDNGINQGNDNKEQPKSAEESEFIELPNQTGSESNNGSSNTEPQGDTSGSETTGLSKQSGSERNGDNDNSEPFGNAEVAETTGPSNQTGSETNGESDNIEPLGDTGGSETTGPSNQSGSENNGENVIPEPPGDMGGSGTTGPSNQTDSGNGNNNQSLPNDTDKPDLPAPPNLPGKGN